jgi:hypothetical protein
LKTKTIQVLIYILLLIAAFSMPLIYRHLFEKRFHSYHFYHQRSSGGMIADDGSPAREGVPPVQSGGVSPG